MAGWPMPAPVDAQGLYRERAERIRRAMALETVDRLPVIYMGTAFSPRYTGMSIARFCADPQARVDATLAAMERLGDLDGINAVPAGRITPALSRMWLSPVAVPGRELPGDSLWRGGAGARPARWVPRACGTSSSSPTSRRWSRRWRERASFPSCTSTRTGRGTWRGSG